MLGLHIPRRILCKITFKTSSGTHITTGYGIQTPLESSYGGTMVPGSDVKETDRFILLNRVGDVLSLGDHVHVGSSSWEITSLKQYYGHCEITGLLLDSSTTDPITESGIVSHYRFGDSQDLGFDYQGNNPLTELNNPSHTLSSSPNAVPQDGSVDFESTAFQRLEIANIDIVNLEFTASFTIAARCKPESIGSKMVLCGTGQPNPDLSYTFYIDSSGNVNCGISSDGATETLCTGATVLAAGSWYALCVSYDQTDIRIYVNGVLDNNGASNPKSATHAVNQNGKKFAIGMETDGSDYFDGLIDDVFLFNESKTAAKVSTWYSTGVW